MLSKGCVLWAVLNRPNGVVHRAPHHQNGPCQNKSSHTQIVIGKYYSAAATYATVHVNIAHIAQNL